jgi:hypothetical protein
MFTREQSNPIVTFPMLGKEPCRDDKRLPRNIH